MDLKGSDGDLNRTKSSFQIKTKYDRNIPELGLSALWSLCVEMIYTNANSTFHLLATHISSPLSYSKEFDEMDITTHML